MKDELIKIISRNSDRYGDLLLKVLDKYDKHGLIELTEEQLKEFIEEEGLS